MALIDTSTEFGQRVERRLREEQVIWLTTVSERDVPQPVPIWFLSTGETELLMYSQANRPKLRNIAAHPTVSLSFNATPSGGDVVVFHGEATIDLDAPTAAQNEPYLDKYGDSISGLSMTPQGFADEYSVPIRVQLTRVRGF